MRRKESSISLFRKLEESPWAAGITGKAQGLSLVRLAAHIYAEKPAVNAD